MLVPPGTLVLSAETVCPVRTVTQNLKSTVTRVSVSSLCVATASSVTTPHPRQGLLSPCPPRARFRLFQKALRRPGEFMRAIRLSVSLVRPREGRARAPREVSTRKSGRQVRKTTLVSGGKYH